MQFDNAQLQNLFLCNRCGATGELQWKACPVCRGNGCGSIKRKKWLFWFYPLTRYHLVFKKKQIFFNKVRKITLIILGVNFWVWFGFLLYKTKAIERIVLFFEGNTLSVPFFEFSRGAGLLFWMGAFIFWYVYYRVIREKQIKSMVEHHEYNEEKTVESELYTPASWQEVFKFSSKQRLNIANTYTQEALSVVGEAYMYADRARHSYVTSVHLLYVLLSSERIANVFIRLGYIATDIQVFLEKILQNDKSLVKDSFSNAQISEDFRQALFWAYEKAYEAHQEYVSVTELVIAAVEESPVLQELLYDIGIEKQKLLNVIEWARVRERLQRSYGKLRHAARHRSTKGMDKAMTAVATPFLNQFSEDVTLLAQFSQTEPCMAREKERAELFRIVEGGGENVILVGPYGVGKKTLVNGLAESMVEDDVPERIRDKRLVRLSVSALLAGTSPSGAIERLISIINEVIRAGNIILYINNIHELMGVQAGGEAQSLDVGDTLAEYLKSGRFFTIATTTPEAYAEVIENTSLAQIFTQLVVKEMDENQAIQALESKIGFLEYKHQVFFSYDAIEKAVQLAKKFIHETYLPGNALEILTESASLVKNKKGMHALVSGEDVAVVVAEKTHIPVTAVSEDESTKLLELEKALHERVIGQDEAVSLVANALRRARAEMRSQNRPIANFLFLGPTGVGKTELAKTIAEVYFGGEERMVRLDMSEYQDKASIYRLIGAPGEKGGGILTEAVRRNPFTLVLLDELEKADKDVLNLFLQVMDDGRLTNSTGQVVDFTNVILIATSNAGTGYVIECLQKAISLDLIKDRLLHGELKEYFRPEFLNRFDGIVLFKPLTIQDVERIVGLMFKKITADLEKKGLELKIEEGALAFFAQVGFDPEFGARPLRRVIQERVENKLAELILSKQLKRRDVIIIDKMGEVTVRA